MESLTEYSKVLVLTFKCPQSRFKFQMDEDMAQMENIHDDEYVAWRIQEIQCQNPNTILQSFCVTEVHKLPKPKK